MEVPEEAITDAKIAEAYAQFTVNDHRGEWIEIPDLPRFMAVIDAEFPTTKPGEWDAVSVFTEPVLAAIRKIRK
jgi:hypothetical protein